MNEKDFQECLLEACTDEGQIEAVETFEAVGMLSMNKGLVVRMNDGSEFQLTIVQSRRPR